MKTVVLASGKVGSLARYLSYLFLRFPGRLGGEERHVLECFDTYDRRWSRQGQIWVRVEGELLLVEPPSRLPLKESSSAFGLQMPLLIGKANLRSRAVTFTALSADPLGEILTVGARSYLVLRGADTKGFAALEAALLADGLAPVPAGGGWWVRDRGVPFEGPTPVEDLSPKTAATFLVERLRDGLRVARQYEAGVIGDVDTECLHQYRVHLRRVRSLTSLGLLWEVVPEWGRLKALLRELQQRTNELRDLDVLLLDLPNHRAALPWDVGGRLEGWEHSLRRRREAQWRQVRTFLKSDDHRLLHEEIERLLADLLTYGEPWTVDELAASAFLRAAKGLRKSLQAVQQDSPDLLLHEVRIRAKRLRYVLDGLGFLGPAEAVSALTARLKRSQDGLGQFQDRAVFLERLKHEAGAVHGKESDLLALGVLIGTIAGQHQTRRSRALDDVEHLKSGPFLKALRALSVPSGEVTRGA